MDVLSSSKGWDRVLGASALGSRVSTEESTYSGSDGRVTGIVVSNDDTRVANANDGEAVYIEVLTKEGEAHVQVYGVEVPNDEPSIACSCWGLKQDEIRLAHESDGVLKLLLEWLANSTEPRERDLSCRVRRRKLIG